MSNEKIFTMLENFRLVREQIDERTFVLALLASLAAALAAAMLYRFFYERRGTGSQVHRSFPLLALSITTLFIGVQVSLPLSLGLLGALSIVRFRVPVKEPEEVGFVMLVIALSISASTMRFDFMAILLVFALISLVIVRGGGMLHILRRDGMLVFSITASAEPQANAEAAMAGFFSRIELESASSRDNTTTMQYVFSGLKRPVPELVAALTEKAGAKSVNVYLDRPGGIR